jgi:hypothetical protein
MTELTIACLVALAGLLYMFGLFDEILQKEIKCDRVFIGKMLWFTSIFVMGFLFSSIFG